MRRQNIRSLGSGLPGGSTIRNEINGRRPSWDSSFPEHRDIGPEYLGPRSPPLSTLSAEFNDVACPPCALNLRHLMQAPGPLGSLVPPLRARDIVIGLSLHEDPLPRPSPAITGHVCLRTQPRPGTGFLARPFQQRPAHAHQRVCGLTASTDCHDP